MQKFAIVIALFGIALSASAADLSGNWTLTGDVEGNHIDLKCYFTQTGEKVDGQCTGALGSPATTGSVTGNKVTLTNILTKGQDYTLVYTGTMDEAGSSVQGTIAVDQYAGTFAMKKVTTPAPATASAADSGFGGTWVFTGDVAGNTVHMRCKFQGQSDKFTGTCTYETDGDSPTTGTVAGKTVTFQNRVTRDQAYDLTYTGTLDDTETSMKGEIAVSGVTGEFTGTKAN